MAAVRKRNEFCCCRVCRWAFESLTDFSGHLSVEGFCYGGVDWAVRDIARIILLRRRFH